MIERATGGAGGGGGGRERERCGKNLVRADPLLQKPWLLKQQIKRVHALDRQTQAVPAASLRIRPGLSFSKLDPCLCGRRLSTTHGPLDVELAKGERIRLKKPFSKEEAPDKDRGHFLRFSSPKISTQASAVGSVISGPKYYLSCLCLVAKNEEESELFRVIIFPTLDNNDGFTYRYT